MRYKGCHVTAKSSCHFDRREEKNYHTFSNIKLLVTQRALPKGDLTARQYKCPCGERKKESNSREDRVMEKMRKKAPISTPINSSKGGKCASYTKVYHFFGVGSLSFPHLSVLFAQWFPKQTIFMGRKAVMITPTYIHVLYRSRFVDHNIIGD